VGIVRDSLEPENLSELVAHYVIVPPGTGAVTRVEFSPDFPEYVVVLYADRPPSLFDVRKQLPDAILRTVMFEELRPTMLAAELAVPINFRQPACAAAFRRQSGRADEVAFAFGSDDYEVHRFALRTRRLRPSIDMEEPVALAYSMCGRRLLTGNKHGLLALHDIEETPFVINSAQGAGRILAVDINYRDHSYAVTDSSLVFGFGSKARESQSFHFKDEDGVEAHETLWTALACDPSSSLMLAATANGRFWTVRTESFDGASCDSIPDSRIMSAQFLRNRRLMLTSEGGVVMHQYTADEDGKITGMGVGDIFALEEERATIVGARHYTHEGRDCVCIALSLRE